MASIRRTSSALIVAAALSLPTLASAEQATEACEGNKMEQKDTTADRSGKQDTSKPDKADDKSDKKVDDKSSSRESGKTS